MREIEFLPDWYHQARRRKRVISLEGWILAILILGLGTWTGLVRANIQRDEASLRTLAGQINQSHSAQRILAEQLSLRQQLRDRQRLIASLGFPLQTTRLMQTLDSVMPKEMSLVELNCDTDEQVRQVTHVSAARASDDSSDQGPQIDRRLKVRLVGVAPSDVDLANFLAGLVRMPFFEQIAVTYAKDKIEAGHVLREFEVTFSMNLNEPIEN